jgi:dolichol-phosphate mannosyltransferase
MVRLAEDLSGRSTVSRPPLGRGRGANPDTERVAVGNRPSPPTGAPRRIWILLPTFDEVLNIRGLVRELRALVPAATILVVDDSSPDGTAAVVEDLARHDPAIRLLLRTDSRGLGSALLAGFEAALTGTADAVVTMDADWSHDPKDVQRLLEALRGADLVVGSRYVHGGRTIGWPWHRRLLSGAANAYARYVLRLEQRDCSSGFRAYRAAGLESLLDRAPESAGYALQEALLFHARRMALTVVEIPIAFQERRAGQSKMGIREAWHGDRILWGVAGEYRDLPLRGGSRTEWRGPRKSGQSH